MKISFSTGFSILQALGMLAHTNGFEDDFHNNTNMPSFSQSLRSRGLKAECNGSPSRSTCDGMSPSECSTYHGCDWTTQYGNKCWGTPLSCSTFNPDNHGFGAENYCREQPGCSWHGESSGGGAPAAVGPSGCFSGENTVDVLIGSGKDMVTKKMKDLAVGDRVRIGKDTFDRVYAFGHRDTENRIDYIKLWMGKRSHIELSKEHLIYANGKVVRADTVEVGDILYNLHGKSAPVTKISLIQNKKGMYAPLTSSGTILVNGVRASTYVAIQSGYASSTEEIKVNGVALPFVNQDRGIHLAIGPLRIVCTLTGSSLGVCKGDYDTEEKLNPYVAWGITMVQWVEQLPPLLQVLVVYGVVIASLILYLFEATVMGSGPLAVRVVVFLVCGAFAVRCSGDALDKKKAA